MTHGGGKPHNVGDRGQRFEVSFFDPTSNSRRVFGWAHTNKGAGDMCDAIDDHPVWTDPQVLDRHAARAAATKTADVGDAIEAHEKRIGRCREPSCRKQIIWLENPATGKNVPVDADTVKPEHDHYDRELGHVSHFSTCTAPNKFSKGKR